MKTLTDTDFFEDVLGILTLPAESTTVLIVGQNTILDPAVFFERFLREFIPELGIVTRLFKNPEEYLVDRNVKVVLVSDVEEAEALHWDYNIDLLKFRSQIFRKTRDGHTICESYYLSQPLTEYV